MGVAFFVSQPVKIWLYFCGINLKCQSYVVWYIMFYRNFCRCAGDDSWPRPLMMLFSYGRRKSSLMDFFRREMRL